MDEQDQSHTPPPLPRGGVLGLILFAVLRYRVSVLVLSGTGLAAGLVYGLVQPNAYTSYGSLLLRLGLRESNIEAQAANVGVPTTPMRQAVSTEIAILTAPEVYQRTLERVGVEALMRAPDPAAADKPDTPLPYQWMHQFQSWWFRATSAAEEGMSEELFAEELRVNALDILRRGINIRNEPGTGIIGVTFTAYDRALAQKVVASFLQTCTRYHVETHSATANLALIQGQLDNAVKEEGEILTKLTEYQKKHDIFDLAKQIDSLGEQILELRRTTRADRALVVAFEQRMERTEAQIQTTSPTIEFETDGSATLNPDYSAANQRIVTLETQLQTLLTSAGGTRSRIEPEVEAINTQIEAAKEERKQIEKFIQPPKIRTRQSNPVFYQMLQLQLETEQSLVQKQAAIKENDAQLKVLEADLKKLQSHRSEVARLTAEAETARSRVEERKRSYFRVQNLSDLDTAEMGNLNQLTPALYPRERSAPKRLRLLILGGMGGAALGLGLAFLRQLLDRRLRRPEEFENIVGAPVMGVIEEFRGALPRPQKAEHRGSGADDLDRSLAPLRHAIDSIWAQIAPNGQEGESLTIGLAAPAEGEGSTVVATAAAIGLARYVRESVLLVECKQSEKGGVADLLELRRRGLSEVLQGDMSVRDAMQQTREPFLSCLVAGTVDAPQSGSFASDDFAKILEQASEGFRFVLLDLPPPADGPATRQLLWKVDALIPVASWGVTEKDGLRDLVQTARSAEAVVAGGVLNRYRSNMPWYLPLHDPYLRGT